jgi:hypothetical protein
VFRKPQYSAIKKSEVYCVRNSKAMLLFISKEYLDKNITFFYASHTIYPLFLCCGILWFAEHYFLGVLGSRLRSVSRGPTFICRKPIQRSGDIIACATRMLQFSSEMQQTWHTYYPMPLEQRLLKMFFYKFRP